MNGTTLKVMFDTNVWLPLFEERTTDSPASHLLRGVLKSEAALYCASISLKDVFYLHQRNMKLRLRSDGIELTAGNAAAIQESAWSCVRSMMELSIVVPVGQREALEAQTYRDFHIDFEDDLIMAAAKRVEVDYLVSFDEKLLRRSPLACVHPVDMIKLLEVRNAELLSLN